jgi:hypothetical protein
MIQTFLITSLFIYGIHATTRHGMIFEFISKWIDNKILLGHVNYNKIAKVLIDCTPCMASLYGTISFVLFNPTALIYYPIWIFCLSGFNYIVNKTMNR